MVAKEVTEVRVVEEAAKANELHSSKKLTSLPVQEIKPSNPTGQIRGVLDDLRSEEDEVSTPQRTPVNVDNECALVP